MTARLIRVRLDDSTWTAGTRERRLEWRAAIRDLVELHRFDLDAPAFALGVTWRDGASEVIATVAATVEDRELARIDLPASALRPQLDEYIDVCRRIARIEGGAGDPHLEALDIAKRITHDEGGEAMQSLCRALAPDHPTGRRLFTLMVTLHTDTTRLALPHLVERRRQELD